MALARRAFPPLGLLLALALGLAAPAEAANTRYLQVNGDARLGDVGTITIETFNKPDILGSRGNGGGPGVNLTTTATCTIVGPSDCIQTAATLRDSLDAQLPASYTVTVHPTFQAVVQVDYTGVGVFNFNYVTDTIPHQSVLEVPAGAIPTLGEWGMILLSALIVASGIYMIRRRPRGATVA